MRFDITLKDAISGLERAFAKAFLNLEIIKAEPLNTNYPKIEEKEADYVCKIVDNENKEYILHIEFQTSNHKYMHFRMLRYLTELHKIHKLPIVQLVIYLGDKKLSMKDGIFFETNFTKIDYKYMIVDMKELDCQTFLESNESDMIIMSILCKKEYEKRELIQKILNKLYELNKNDENSYKNYILKLETISELRGLQEIIKEEENKMVEAKISVQKLPSYMLGVEDGRQIGFEKGIESGIEKGIQKGIQKGKQIGIYEGFIESALILIKNGYEIQKIAKDLNIPIEEIEKRLK